MGAERLKKLDELPGGVLFGIAAALVFMCQLVAMVLVVEGQVQRAHTRQTAQHVQGASSVPAVWQAQQIQSAQKVSEVSAVALQGYHHPAPSVQLTAMSEKLLPTSFAPR